MARMTTGMPAQKVTFATAAAAAATVIVSVFGEVLPSLKNFQEEFVTIITFLAGYMMPPSPADTVEVTKPAAEE